MSTISSGNTTANAITISADVTGTLSMIAASGLVKCLGNGAIIMPSGTDATRPASPINGMIRYNTTSSVVEGYANNTWVKFT